MPSLNLSKTVDEARKEAGSNLILNLSKNGLTRKAATSRVILVLDVSGSTEDLYNDRYMQLITTMVAGAAMNLDDDQQLDMVAFDSDLYTLPTLNASNAETYVDRYIFDSKRHSFRIGGHATRYAKPLKHLMSFKPGDPVFCPFITDGENQDQAEALAALIALSYHGPVFVQTVGVGYGLRVAFDNLKEMNSMGVVSPDKGEEKGPRLIDNAGFCTVDFKHATDQQVYDALLNEYPSFLAKATAKGYLPWTKSPLASQPGTGLGGIFGRR